VRIPNEMLKESITIEDANGAGAYGVQFAASRTVKANVQETERLLVDTRGRQVLATILVMIRPEKGPVPIESKVTWVGETYRVVRSFPIPDSVSPSHFELTLAPWDMA